MTGKLRGSALFLCFTVPLCANAELIDTRLFKEDVCGSYKVLHVNGVDSSRDSARSNLNNLATAFGNAHDGHRVSYGLAYNQTATLGMDIMAALQQTLANLPGVVSFQDWVRAYYRAIFPDWFPAEWFASVWNDLAPILNLQRPDPFYDADLIPMVAEIQALGFNTRDTRLLIVGHSQGSIYANVLFRRLRLAGTAPAPMQPGQIGLMSIAAFVAVIEGTGSEYVTNTNDRPVNTARGVYSDIRAGTVTIPHTEAWDNPWRGHNLISKYLADDNSRGEIVSKMGMVLSRLAAPGPFSVETKYTQYQFQGVSGWADCTPGVPGRSSGICWTTFDSMVVYSQVANTLPTPYRPGDRSETEGLARAHRDSCVALAASIWQAYRLGQPLPSYGDWSLGGYPNCGPGVSDLLNRFGRYYAADWVQEIVQQQLHLPAATGAAVVYARPMCRRAT